MQAAALLFSAHDAHFFWPHPGITLIYRWAVQLVPQLLILVPYLLRIFRYVAAAPDYDPVATAAGPELARGLQRAEVNDSKKWAKCRDAKIMPRPGRLGVGSVKSVFPLYIWHSERTILWCCFIHWFIVIIYIYIYEIYTQTYIYIYIYIYIFIYFCICVCLNCCNLTMWS